MYYNYLNLLKLSNKIIFSKVCKKNYIEKYLETDRGN